MPWFRPPAAPAELEEKFAGPVLLDRLHVLLEQVVWPAHFFTGPGINLVGEHQARQEVPWELFRGRLVPPAQTRQRQVFETWNIYLVEDGIQSAEPVLSLKLDASTGQLHVTRGIQAYVWEGYDAGDNVILSREVPRWTSELAATIDLAQFHHGQALQDELIGRLFQAVVGASRLALTSLEGPLPAFSLGRLAYCFRAASLDEPRRARPMRSPRELLAEAWQPDLAWIEKVKLLETVLRATPAAELAEAAALFARRWQDLGNDEPSLTELFQGLFNEVALSPYTDFVPKTLAFLAHLEGGGWLSPAGHVDFLGRLLRQLGRHLTAFDLVTFHHQGANYPDLLLLDAVLREFLSRAAKQPELFLDTTSAAGPWRVQKRLRRRGLRQGLLLRRRYEGLPVPDAPTSPGENSRVWPAPLGRIPEEQITNPVRRRKHLFEDQPLQLASAGLIPEIVRQSLRDLHEPEELRELGMALFLDRPLGMFKAPGEPNQTPLLSYEAFSRSVARHRLRFLAETFAEFFKPEEVAADEQLLESISVPGVALNRAVISPRVGEASLGDAFRVADDFVLLRTTARSVRDFLAASATSLTELLPPSEWKLIVRGSAVGEPTPGLLVVFDRHGRRRLDLQMDRSAGYVSRGGVEFPAAGLKLLARFDG
jgi:hypothetical protein